MATDPRYPIGKEEWKGPLTEAERAEKIRLIAETPQKLRDAVLGLDDAQLDTPYREGGWTVRQVVHHLPDSHLNAYVRMRLALTEERPLVKTYEEAAWAELVDARTMAVEPSLCLLWCLHERWVCLLESLKPEDFARTFRHPDHKEPQVLDRLLVIYAWHGPHHVAQITELRKRRGW